MHFFLIFLFLMPELFSQTWHRTETNHFVIYIEGKWKIPAIEIELEKIYSILKFNVSSFSQWMLNEKTNIYIFKNQESYMKSEFRPPVWSKGLCFHKTRTIVVYYRQSIKDLSSTIIHELTHLYFEDFFIRKLNAPPLWLNEGLAVYMESLYQDNESQWKKSLMYAPKERFISFSSFVKTNPNDLKSDEDIAWWYLQAYGLVRYIYSNFSRAAFYRFVTDIAKGKKLEKALWDYYRIYDWENFEKRWYDWLQNIKNDEKFEFKPFKQMEFKNLN